jgi:hypothetical protein
VKALAQWIGALDFPALLARQDVVQGTHDLDYFGRRQADCMRPWLTAAKENGLYGTLGAAEAQRLASRSLQSGFVQFTRSPILWRSSDLRTFLRLPMHDFPFVGQIVSSVVNGFRHNRE